MADARALAWRWAPGLMANRALAYQQDVEVRVGNRARAQAFVAAHGDAVLAGPFAGLRYDPAGSTAVAKLLGTYECELDPVWERALARGPGSFLDVGAADGFYLAGVVRRVPGLPALGFEASGHARRRCRSTLERNGLRVPLRRTARASNLRSAIGPAALILCDCEGAEVDLLPTRTVMACRDADLIIEIHDHVRPSTTSILTQRFAASHETELVLPAPRRPERHPELELYAPQERAAAIDEMRGRQAGWLVCWSRSRA